jgi:hypothetical protein
MFMRRQKTEVRSQKSENRRQKSDLCSPSSVLRPRCSAIRFLFSVLCLLFCVASVWGQSSTNQPQIGYLYPAGGQRGTTIQITAGGQILRGATDVYISGEGVHAKIVKYIRPLRNIQKEQRELLQARMKEVRDKRLAELPIKYRPRTAPAKRTSRSRSRSSTAAKKPPAKKPEPAKPEISIENRQSKVENTKLPDHPLLEDLDNKSLRELAHIRSMLFFPRTKLQINRQLAEMVMIEVTIDPDAAPGNRELRLRTRAGLTNPVVFQVGLLPEVRELEPNNQRAYPELPNLPKLTSLLSAKPIMLPVYLNGQIMPGDVDRFRFRAVKGQKLVIQAHARRLIRRWRCTTPGATKSPTRTITVSIPTRFCCTALQPPGNTSWRFATPSIAGGRISSIASPSASSPLSRRCSRWAARRAPRPSRWSPGGTCPKSN